MYLRHCSAKDRRRDSRDRYKAFPYGNKKWLRTMANRAIRREPDLNGNFSCLHKVRDVWWTLW